MIRRGIGVQSFVSAGGGTDADAQAFITAAGITDATQQSAINTLVTDLKGYGIWSKMKAIWPMVGGTASTHKWNLRDPRDLDAAFRLVFSGGITHSSTGVLWNGTNGYGNTYLMPATSLTTSSGHFSYYSRSNPANAAQYEMGTSEVIGILAVRFNAIISKFTNGLFYAAYGEYNATVSNSDSRGLFITNRNSGTTTTGFKNGTKVITQSQTAALSTLPMYIGGENGNGTAVNFSAKECAFASIGDGLTDTEAANLYTAVQKYQTTLGRSVGTQTVSDSDAQAFVNAAVIEDQVQATAINTLVTDLKGYGIWSKMKAIYPFVGGTSSSHKWNLKDPRDLDAAFRLVFSGGGTHASTGWTPNGVNGYGDSFFNPISQSTSTSNFHLSVYTRTANINGTSRGFIGSGNFTTSRNYTALGFFSAGTREIGTIAGVGGIDYSPDQTLSAFAGFKNISVNGSRSARYFKNGVFQSNAVTQADAYENRNLFVGAVNDAGSAGYFQNVQFAFTSIGDGLTDTEAANLYTAVQAYQTTLSRQVS